MAKSMLLHKKPLLLLTLVLLSVCYSDSVVAQFWIRKDKKSTKQNKYNNTSVSKPKPAVKPKVAYCRKTKENSRNQLPKNAEKKSVSN
jgi:hypothetical protein